MLKNRRFWIGVGLSILFLFLFLYQTDFTEMGQALREANYVFLLPGIALYFAGVFFRALRWRYLLRPLGTFSSFLLFPLIVIGFLVNNVLPARLGIVARAYLLGKKEGVSKMAVGGTMVVEQVFDGVTLLLFAAIISLFVPLGGLLQQAVYIAAGLFLGALVLCFILASSQQLTQWAIAMLLRILPTRLGERVEEWLNLLLEGLGIMRSPGRLLILLAMSMPVWLCEAGVFYMVGLSFDLGQPFYVFLLAAAISNLAWALLMTPGGLGPFDYFCQQTLIYFGVAEAAATSYTVVLHAVILLPMIVLGFVFLWVENLSLTRLMPQENILAQGHDTTPQTRGD
ncbi:MAG: lysylphosphatidylglycerol synthase transmembrane domain-containing protein [Chloroflexota bacterium]|nr:lysylphosphatidylglycerol synthase transmembrane domain-containing protein [Chloroflexota bacterium]